MIQLYKKHFTDLDEANEFLAQFENDELVPIQIISNVGQYQISIIFRSNTQWTFSALIDYGME